jgi:fructose-bisphosphate aldolase, class II
MTLSNSTTWLQHARQQGYAIGAFNANSLEQMQAIVGAAREECAPVVIQISRRALLYIGAGNLEIGLRYTAQMGRVACESVGVPVILHLDHGSEDDVIKAIAGGFSSVMFDGGDLPYEANIRQTRWLCEQAHAAGVSFEAELGEVPRLGVEGSSEGVLTDPAEAAEFVALTGVDALAVALGSVHAMRRKEVELDFARLDAISAAVAVPLVLHGSSGVTDASILQGIRRGLAKVNVATQLNQAFTDTVRAYLEQNPEDVDPRKYLNPARSAMQESVRERIRLFGSTGRAA